MITLMMITLYSVYMVAINILAEVCQFKVIINWMVPSKDPSDEVSKAMNKGAKMSNLDK